MNLPIKKSEFLQRSKGIGFLSYKTIDNTTKLNDLFQKGKQIVLTTDKHTTELIANFGIKCVWN